MCERWDSLAAFYDGDPRRRRSPEADYGVWWTGSADFPKYRVSYVKATGEVYAIELAGRGCVEVLAVVEPDEDDIYYRSLDEILLGWADHCGQPNSLEWVRERLSDAQANGLTRRAEAT